MTLDLLALRRVFKLMMTSWRSKPIKLVLYEYQPNRALSINSETRLRRNLDVIHARKNPGQSTASQRIEPNKINAGKPRNRNIRFVSSNRIASNDIWSLAPPALKIVVLHYAGDPIISNNPIFDLYLVEIHEFKPFTVERNRIAIIVFSNHVRQNVMKSFLNHTR